MATHSSVLAWRIPRMGEPVGCRLWGHTESDTTDVTQQQQQQHSYVFYSFHCNGEWNCFLNFSFHFLIFIVCFSYFQECCSEHWSTYVFFSYGFLRYMGFPGHINGKGSACNVGDLSLITGLGRSPGQGDGNPLQYSFPENSMGRGAQLLTFSNIFSHSESCSFTLFKASFAVQKLLNLIRFHLFIFVFTFITLKDGSKSIFL